MHNEIFLLILAGIVILVCSLLIYLKLSKLLLHVIRDSAKQLLIFLYPTLIGLFIIGYAVIFGFLYFYRLEWGILIGLILFGGSIFVFISVDMVKRLVKDVMNAKLNIIDPLTGLMNREGARLKAEQLMESGVKLTLVIIDMDNFKLVNDNLGHAEGDMVLQEAAKILRNLMREEDIAARYGGDEFLIIKKFVPESEAKILCSNIIEKIQKCFGNKFDGIKLGCSIGVAASQEMDNYVSLFRRADESLYQAKKTGKNTYILYPLSE